MASASIPKLSGTEYADLTTSVRSTIVSATPLDTTVAVVSKGDEALVMLPGRRGWHFPRTEAGEYAGHHPADSEAAIAHLEALRMQGVDYFALPATAFWWLDYYDALREHLEHHYAAVARSDSAIVYAVSDRSSDRPAPALPAARDPHADQMRSYLVNLLPDEAVVALVQTDGPR